jgi:glutamine synthetase
MLDAYIELKTGELQRFRQAVHPIEFEMYYSL